MLRNGQTNVQSNSLYSTVIWIQDKVHMDPQCKVADRIGRRSWCAPTTSRAYPIMCNLYFKFNI